jgi:hypothetical protein
LPFGKALFVNGAELSKNQFFAPTTNTPLGHVVFAPPPPPPLSINTSAATNQLTRQPL